MDLNDHPFSPASIARESGIPDQTERAWLRFVAECERLLGHDLDGNDTAGFDCGYSLDEAHDKWRAGYSAHAYVAMVGSRDRYKENGAMPFDLETARLTRQSYGIAGSQARFGGPRGLWLECPTCNESQVIVGSNSDEWAKVPTEEAAKVFVRHGWTGEGPVLRRARCPRCFSTGASCAA